MAWRIIAIATVAFGVVDSGTRAESFQVTVTTEQTKLPVAIVTSLLPESLKGKNLDLVDNAGKPVSVQADSKNGEPAFTFVVTDLASGEPQRFRLAESTKDPTTGVEVKLTDEGAEVWIDGEHFTTYQTQNGPKPYLWPIHGPTGKPMTRAFPMKRIKGEAWDHFHHRGLWFTFDRVNDENFWLEAPKAGKTIHREFASTTSGPVFGEIVSIVDWMASSGTKVAEDTRSFRFYEVPDARVIDFSIEMRSVDGSLRFGDSKEGLFAIRVAEPMKVEAKIERPGHILNASGDADGDAWGKRAEWCDYHGILDGEHLGIAIFDAPTNFRHPTYWHVRTYGLFAANPFGISHFTGDKNQRGDHEVPEGESFRLSYRVYIHRGDAESAKVGQWYEAFANPPTVTVEPK